MANALTAYTNSLQNDRDHVGLPPTPYYAVLRPSRWARDERRFHPNTTPKPTADRNDRGGPTGPRLGGSIGPPSALPWPDSVQSRSAEKWIPRNLSPCLLCSRRS